MNNLNPLWLIIFASAAALLPLLVGLLTSYLKVSIVLGVLKSALGTQQVPSAMVVMALSLAITLYIMDPQITASLNAAKLINFPEQIQDLDLNLLEPVTKPWFDFIVKHAGKKELMVLSNKSDLLEQESYSTKTILVAFVLTELKEAFSIAFLLLLPFLVIDLVVANVLVGLGMHMVSPVMISLPLKILLFVASDAWILLTKGLINSYLLN